ncbi:lipoate--protein ligase family protein [Sulfurospirillum sp. 1612]|uniref:lipoate--protein ligase family protein n=1 Tax=Sulfurospirillum sp. 1612 TaxID=3094835 RepID=UPI002F91C23C
MARALNTEWRFIDSPSLSAQENMSIDASLLTGANLPVFRLYSWEPNCFSIGRFQKIEEIKDWHIYGKKWAQRITGGGLLLHGFDVSYTVVMPIAMLGKRSVKQSYEYICEFLLNFYKNLGLHPHWAKDILPDSLSHSSFCQEGFEPYDIIIEGKKIGGNAQKRTKDVILQHGSIPIQNDPRAQAGYSLEAFGISLDIKKTKALLKKSFCDTYDIRSKS